MPDDDWPEDDPILDDRRHRVGAVLIDGLKEFAYTYDFGDNWRHTVTIEKVMEPNELNTWPVCLAGKNACPPETSGA